MNKFAKIIVGVFGLVAALYIVVATIGFLDGKPHVKETTVTLDTSLDKTWTTINEVEKYSEWIDFVKTGTRVQSKGKPYWAFTGAFNNTLLFQVLTEPKKSLKMFLSAEIYYLQISFDLKTENKKTIVKITQEEMAKTYFRIGLLKLTGKKYTFDATAIIANGLQKRLKS